MAMKYEWKNRSWGVDAAAAGKELEKVRKSNGGQLRAPDVVEAARPEDAPLHPAFEWRDDVAAEKWREHEARHIIKDIVIIKQDAPPIPMYVHTEKADPDTGKKASYYQSTTVAVTNFDEWASALMLANDRVAAVRGSLESLERLAAKQEDGDRLARLALALKSLDAVWRWP
jgi:hypothetical protein